METHEFLVRVRNNVAREGAYDVGVYALGDCGSPRCVLGWCGTEAGIGSENVLFEPSRRPVYRDALTVLWECRPRDPDPEWYDSVGLAARVEDVAFQLARDNHLDPAGELAAVLGWFDAAIAATAPPPLWVECPTTKLVTA
jgi:hypothetical protein